MPVTPRWLLCECPRPRPHTSRRLTLSGLHQIVGAGWCLPLSKSVVGRTGEQACLLCRAPMAASSISVFCCQRSLPTSLRSGLGISRKHLTPESHGCQPFDPESLKAPYLPWWEDRSLRVSLCRQAPNVGRTPASVHVSANCSCKYLSTAFGNQQPDLLILVEEFRSGPVLHLFGVDAGAVYLVRVAFLFTLRPVP